MTWHTTKEAAAYLRMTPSGVRDLVQRGELAPDGHGPRRCLMFRTATLDAWFTRYTVGHEQEGKGDPVSGRRAGRAGQVPRAWTCPKTGRRRDSSKVLRARSAADAAGQRERLVREIVEPRRAGRVRLTDYARTWLRSKHPTLKASTRRLYVGYLSNHILPALGEYFVDAIDKADIVEWRDVQKGSPHSVNGRLRLLRTLFADATADLELRRNPTAGVGSLATGEKKNLVMKARELAAFMRAVDGFRSSVIPAREIVRVQALTGARWGAVTALKWGDIDDDEKTITFRRAHWKGIVSTTKTANVRTVAMDDETAALLRAHRVWMFGSQHPGLAEGWALCDVRGILVNPGQVRPCFDVGSYAAGRRVIPKMLRHTFNDLVRRVTTGTVQRSITGHSTQAMSDHYSEVDMDEKRKALAGVARLIGGGE